METKFTKAPWQQSHRKNTDGYSTEVYDNKGETICTLAWHKVYERDGVTSTDRQENAHLIAAAPDMYGELNKLSLVINKTSWNGFNSVDLIDEIRSHCDIDQILKKARGE